MKICNKCNKIIGLSNKIKPGHICIECFSNRKKPGGYYYEQHLKQCKAYRDKTKERKKEFNKKYHEKNPEYYKKYNANWVAANKLRHRTSSNEYQKHRRNTDPVFRLASVCRSRIKNALKRKGLKKHRHLRDYMGCTLEELRNHLEKQFKPGMTWENHGKKGWHVDHKIPLAMATTEQDLYSLCHYSNLQPLWAEENYKKGNRI